MMIQSVKYVKYVALFLAFIVMSDLHAGGGDCPTILPTQYNGSIDMWGVNYQPCTYKEWLITMSNDIQYALLEYKIDINTSGAIDFVQVFVSDGNNGEIEVLDYDNAPMTGVLPIYTPNSVFRVVYLGATEENNELYNGFKITVHPTTETIMFQDQVFFKNLGVGITPKTRLHVNGYVRGDGTNGSLRIKTKRGETEIGAQDYNYSHFNTDRSAFFFSKPITLADGRIRTYANNANASSLSLACGDSTILSLSDTIAQLNAPLNLRGPISGHRPSNSLRIQTDYGWVDIGSTHWEFMYFYTDRSKFYFDKPITIHSGIISSYQEEDLRLQTFNRTRLTIQDGTGNVGIGIDTPLYKLDVVGKIHSDTLITTRVQTNTLSSNRLSSGSIQTNYVVTDTIRSKVVKSGAVFVESVYGADYVFDKGYNLLPLHEVADFILENGHLPEIQSAADMQQNGVNMSEFQIQLLQKIEELTLYIIRQDERIKDLEYQLSK